MTYRIQSISFITCTVALLAGCSDPIPPASEGAYGLHFSQPSGCIVKAHNVQVGYVDYSEYRNLKQDTVAGVNIYCSVTGSGTFDIEAYISEGTNHMDFIVKGVTREATATDPAKGAFSFSSAETAGKVYSTPSDEPCEFFFDGDAQEVAQGRSWMGYSCPNVTNASSNSTCRIQLGHVAVQNCEQ